MIASFCIRLGPCVQSCWQTFRANPKQIYAKRCSAGASRSVINMIVTMMWVTWAGGIYALLGEEAP